jgi:hypothetical protein
MKKQPLLLTVLLFASLLFFLLGCSKKSSDPCSGVTIVVSGTKVDNTANDGSISATATGSTGFTYRLNSGTFQASGDFTGLSAGIYTVTAKDVNGCSGSESFTIENTKTYYLAKAGWKFSSATLGGFPASSTVQNCQKDNVFTFQTGGNGSMDEGLSKCNAADPQTVSFTWNFAGNETTLHVSTPLFTGGSSDFTIVTLSDTQLVLSQIFSGQPLVVTFTHP